MIYLQDERRDTDPGDETPPGGVYRTLAGEIMGCVGDDEWIDLAYAYLAACEDEGREPLIAVWPPHDADEEDE